MIRRLARRLLVALLLPTLASASLADGEPKRPRIELSSDGAMRVTELPALLDDPDVGRHLATGLTTTIEILVSWRASGGGREQAASRVEIRFALWDEDYHVATLDAAGRWQRQILSSPDDLLRWWREASITVFRRSPRRPLLGRLVRVELAIIPFSDREMRDTQQWFSESIDRAGRGTAEEVSRATEDRSQALSEVFNLLMATSIQRRAVLSYRWQVELSRSEQ